jgi:dihydroorotate dehydrogenase
VHDFIHFPGHEFTVPKMRALRRREEYDGIIGINIDRNKKHDLVKDISYGVKVFSPVANYLAVNIERNLSKETLRELLIEINAARMLFDPEKQRPIFLKLSPDLSSDELKDIVKIVSEKNCKIHGFIISNGTSDRNLDLKSKHQIEEGELSGKPLKEKSTKMIEEVYKLTKGKITIIGVGGICSGKDAFEKILAGASAVQIYTSFIYHGPPVIACE